MVIKELDYDKLIQIIDERRLDQGISLEELSKATGLSNDEISRIFKGYVRPREQHLKFFLSLLNITEEELPLLSSPPTKSTGNNIFISYCHRDKEFLDRLLVHLKPLERKELIDPWDDTRLLAGDKWKEEIEKALNNARVAILLISADFLASDFIIENELQPLLHSAEESGTLIIPVLLKPSRFGREESLCKFQSIIPLNEPLSLINDDEREVIYDSISQRIEKVIDKF